jgi:hypothetical protein
MTSYVQAPRECTTRTQRSCQVTWAHGRMWMRAIFKIQLVSTQPGTPLQSPCHPLAFQAQLAIIVPCGCMCFSCCWNLYGHCNGYVLLRHCDADLLLLSPCSVFADPDHIYAVMRQCSYSAKHQAVHQSRVLSCCRWDRDP